MRRIKYVTNCNYKQAEAELCQAQEKLGLAKPALPSKNLRWSSI